MSHSRPRISAEGLAGAPGGGDFVEEKLVLQEFPGGLGFRTWHLYLCGPGSLIWELRSHLNPLHTEAKKRKEKKKLMFPLVTASPRQKAPKDDMLLPSFCSRPPPPPPIRSCRGLQLGLRFRAAQRRNFLYSSFYFQKYFIPLRIHGQEW